MTIRFSSYSMKVEKKYDDDWYDWCVFVDEKEDVIDSIKYVEYTLHPTFLIQLEKFTINLINLPFIVLDGVAS